jgi:citrate lyase subunit beta/citryl-CoA lyase
MTTARSYLYVPGDKPEVLAKALGRGADALIVDLEDAVAPSAKDEARGIVAQFLAGLPPAEEAEVEIWVRVNGDNLAPLDIDWVAAPSVRGFVLAKTERPRDVENAAAACSRQEVRLGIIGGSFGLVPLLESAAAVLDARAIASSSSRVTRLQVGEADLRADIGVTPGEDERELLMVRSSVVLASAAAGIDPPVGPVSTNFRDLDVLRASTEALARLGYVGRACIHPAQAAVVNEVFTPSEESVASARALVEAYDAAIAAGQGVFTDESGRMVDLAVVRQARRTLSLAR